jgi:hypothetical protein
MSHASGKSRHNNLDLLQQLIASSLLSFLTVAKKK